jgi:hypothetical protein
MISLLLCFCAHANSYYISGSASEKNNKYVETYMIDFSNQEEGLWRITNDGVMGGLSNGNMSFYSEHGVFSGDISLDNNGGFSSVFRALENLPESFDQLVIDIEGDGQAYQLRVVIYINGYRLAYKHDFKTVANKREKLIFQLADFQATFRGRMIKDAPVLSSEDIREVGFLMTKKIAGKFSLSIFQLFFLKE